MEHGQAPPLVRDRTGVKVALAHAVPVLWLFGGALFAGRVLYARDVSAVYAPDFSFLHRALAQGVWPLWNPYVDGGSPCLFAYPVDLVLVALFGPLAPIGIGAALHLFVAMCGASVLARGTGQGWLGAWLAGSVYGLSGYLLSSMNLLQFLEAAAWAPWVLAALLRLQTAPTRRSATLLAGAAAFLASTLCVEIALQTLVAGLLLVSGKSIWRRQTLRWLVAAGGLAVLLSAPAILGGAWLIEGSPRERGFTAEQSLAYSASPLVLLESIVPRLFGNVHAFSEVGFWGQPFFPQGYPYLVSLYVGPIVLALALLAPPGRLHLLLVLGVALALGHYGPFGEVFFPHVSFLRGPVKFFFAATLALALLAGRGLERAYGSATHRRRGQALLIATGATALLAGISLGRAPDLAARLLGAWLPELLSPRALVVAETTWPEAWIATGAACLAVSLVLAVGVRAAPLAVVVVVIDLLTVNGGLNPLADRSFYELRSEMAAVVRDLKEQGLHRVFSYGAANSPALRWQPQVAQSGSDVWLYYVDRQSLLPRTPELDGLESIFDNDRTGWAPAGSVLTIAESAPPAFRAIEARLREANVRFVLSFEPLPPDLVELRRQIPFPEVEDPLLVYEIHDFRPRVSWVARAPAAPPEPEGAASYHRLDPHTVEIAVRGGPGEVVVLDAPHPDWRLETVSGPATLERVDRHLRFETPGGERSFFLRFRPSWRWPALALFVIGILVVVSLLVIPVNASPQRLDTAEPAR